MFDARHQPGTSAAPSQRPFFTVATIPSDILASVGETLAAATCQTQKALGEATVRSADRESSACESTLAELGRIEHLGIQLQQVARVLSGEGLALPETFDLTAAVRRNLTEWAGAAEKRKVPIKLPAAPLSVEAVPGVIEQLLDLATEEALRIAAAIDVEVALQGMPAHPMLTLHIARRRHEDDSDERPSLSWQLFVLLARASGLSPQRLSVGGTTTLMLGFPTQKTADAEALAERSAALLPRTPIAAGCQVLLLEPRDMTRLYAHRLMQAAGMRVDATVTLEQARDSLCERLPDVLVTGVSTQRADCLTLIDEIRAAQPRLRVIELVEDDSAFALSLPGSNRAGRIGLHDLARTLVIAVSQELIAA